MKVELRCGEQCETVICEDDVFFVACRLTEPNGHLVIAEDMDAYKSIFDTAGCRTKELCLENGMRLEMCLFTTEDPFMSAMMSPYAGMRMLEVVYGDTALTITV